MSETLDLQDIQGGILRAYGRQGFPKARYFFLNVRKPEPGRRFVEALRSRITTAAAWRDPKQGRPFHRGHHPRVIDTVRARGLRDYPGEVHDLIKPKVAINIAFTFMGFVALGIPTRTLRGMPDEFIDGMAQRAAMLGDEAFLDQRDAIWRNSHDATQVHILVSMNAEMNPDGTPVAELGAETAWLNTLCNQSNGDVVLLSGHGPAQAAWQDMSAVLKRGADGVLAPTNKEHFDFSDGFGDPVFEGQFAPEAEVLRVIGGGKIARDQSWRPLATGEFLLGHPDEAQEIPGAAMPIDFSRNGTFMAYRKLHENVAALDQYIVGQAAIYARVMGIDDPDEASATLKAKIVGRWPDGVPLLAAPTYAAWKAFNGRLAAVTTADDQAPSAQTKAELAEIALEYVNFKYRSDPDGAVCPVTSHLRRANTRDFLDPSPDPKTGGASVLNNRRRILRRGLPYGAVDPAATDDSGEHGIIFLAICASLFRQFEFVQQQWIQYGLDFNVGNDTCPLLGNRDSSAKFVIPADPASDQPPFICDGLPQLVEPRGGDYFFIPSMTALRMIGLGIVDPT